MTNQDKKKCTNCGKVKPLDDFHKQVNGVKGKASRCKVCMNEYYKQKDTPKLLKHYDYDNISAVQQYEVDGAINVLRACGYDLDSPLSVHEQFLLRHQDKLKW